MSLDSANNEDDNESSGFGSFCGFDLEGDLSEDSLFNDDELERPGKTYEYVNFVDPKYADKTRKSSSYLKNNIKHDIDIDIEDDELIQSAPGMKPTTSSLRSLKNLPHIKTTQSKKNLSNQTPRTPLTPPDIIIREDAEVEDDNININNNHDGHIHNHSIHLTYNGTALQRQDTTSEIAAEHGSIEKSYSTLNDGRKEILNHRRINRRYVWKDAEKYDIICLIASPCETPIRPTTIIPHITNNNNNNISQSNENPPIINKTISIKNICLNNNNNDYLATVDDDAYNDYNNHYNNHYNNRRNKKNKNKKNKNKKNKNKNKNKNKQRQFGEFVKSKKRDSKIIAASDSELLKRDNNKNINILELHRNKSLDSLMNLDNNRYETNNNLQHFGIKGIQTLLYDGILCSIHQNVRFLCLGGTVNNTLSKINGCKLLHYIGYAFNGKLLLESDYDVGLGQLIDPLDKNINKNIIDRMTQCVVIQSPTHMEVAEIFLKLKVKHVVAIRQPQDNFAHHITDFITQFYFALIESNTTIARAFRTAFKLFEDSNYLHKKYHDTIYDDFKLLPENIDHELILFRDQLFNNGKPTNYSSKLSPHNNLQPIRPFIGRWNDVYKVMNMIRDKKLSIIYSNQPGYGRTAIITMAARYLWERYKFKGGVFHIKSNFDKKKITNLAELILDTLDIAEIDNYNEIINYYNNIINDNYYHNKIYLLAVEILYKYVNTNINTKPICLLFSDFDEIPFDPLEKFSFLCALIERFDDEIENPPDIGTRIVITCLTKTVSQIQYFMDRLYNNNNNYRQHSKSAPVAPVNISSGFGGVGVFDYSKLPMQYKRGHKIIKPLENNDLIKLFLQMINIASTQTIYKYNNILKHKPLLELFDHKPFKVKQIAEYVLQTFDDNLSRQQFQYEENEEADYGLIYEFDDDTDSDGELDGSKLELKLDQFSDYTPTPTVDNNNNNNNNAAAEIPFLAITSKNKNQTNQSTKSFDIYNPYKKRKSKLIKVVSIKKIKSNDSYRSLRLKTHRLSDASSISFTNLLKGPISTRTSIPFNMENMKINSTKSINIPFDLDNFDNLKDKNLSYKILPKSKSKQNVLLESTIVPSDDCHILLTKNNNTNSNLSSRNICVDMAVNSLDCKKAFIRQKIQYLIIHNKSSTNHMTNNSGMKTNHKSFTNHMNKSMDYNGINVQFSYKKLPGNTSILPHMSSLQNIQSGVEYYYSNSDDKLHEEPSLPNKIYKNKSTQRLPTHNKKNVSFSINNNSHHHNNNSHYPKTLSMKLSKPKLRLQNESIPIPTSTSKDKQQRISTIVSNQNNQNNQDTDDECIDDTIKKAWPCLDLIVEGFKKLQDERMIREHNNVSNNRYYNYNIINEPIQEEIAHIPTNIQKRFKNMDPPIASVKNMDIGPFNKLYHVNVSSYDQQRHIPFNEIPYTQSNQISSNQFHVQLNGMTMNQTISNHIIENKIGRDLWIFAGGKLNNNDNDYICFNDLLVDFYNYFIDKTSNKYLKIDTQSFTPLIKTFIINPNKKHQLHVTAKVFNNIWKWFDNICDIVNETNKFWNSKTAKYHGFVTREIAEKELLIKPFGTFIIRFTAPNPDIVITFNDKTKQHTHTNSITHIKLIRTHNCCDLYENINIYNHQKDKLKVWIQKIPEFKYIFTKEFDSSGSVHKNEYFT